MVWYEFGLLHHRHQIYMRPHIRGAAMVLIGKEIKIQRETQIQIHIRIQIQRETQIQIHMRIQIPPNILHLHAPPDANYK